jgi:hypothetical protein
MTTQHFFQPFFGIYSYTGQAILLLIISQMGNLSFQPKASEDLELCSVRDSPATTTPMPRLIRWRKYHQPNYFKTKEQ